MSCGLQVLALPIHLSFWSLFPPYHMKMKKGEEEVENILCSSFLWIYYWMSKTAINKGTSDPDYYIQPELSSIMTRMTIMNGIVLYVRFDLAIYSYNQGTKS